MKTLLHVTSIIFSAFVLGCSSIEVTPVGQLIDTSKKPLSQSSKTYYKLSGVNDFVPSEKDKNAFYSNLAFNENYRKYLTAECILLLHQEQGLNIDRPVYSSWPQWNNIENLYYLFLSFQSTDKELLTEQTMECDVAIDKNKEVKEYQLKKSRLQVHKKN